MTVLTETKRKLNRFAAPLKYQINDTKWKRRTKLHLRVSSVLLGCSYFLLFIALLIYNVSPMLAIVAAFMADPEVLDVLHSNS